MQAVQRARIDLQDQVVDVFEDQVQRADRVTDRSRNLPCTQALVAVFHHDFLGSRQGQLPEFLAAVITASRHAPHLVYVVSISVIRKLLNTVHSCDIV
jgi:hypothetical protein